MAARKTSNQTTLDSHLDRPSVTATGDGPADTTDPAEVAVSAVPDKAAAALAGHGMVNAVIPVGRTDAQAPSAPSRIETYQRVRPDGQRVTVTHDLTAGTTTATPVTD
ncbi:MULTISPECIES: hypothetical protein [Actinosynnema]|uniref:Uncharacterized protein n=1 Tax=Actinosynnema pretiosum TaxID=42197 RepID=A0A290ZAY7_9PSEU|nr:hypothetical protein [Actinosynnema pretiosum]ATE56149.1 hypothetical protein CNX65_25105 [Actinosynnema pretiosum]MCP2098599.1 hypothetical protein [Actinosynnema pretiosum]